jgi:hypothetical protein
MAAPGHARTLAIATAEALCPRCSARRSPSQAYCLECGLRLPVTGSAVAALRRGWIRSIGWYPGDWVWLSLAAFLVAAGGAAAAISVNRHHAAAAATTFVTPAPHAVAATTTPAGPNGETAWPAGLGGFTVVLLSAPAPNGQGHPEAVARRAARAGLQQVGVLDSSNYSSLHPGYYIVFAGIYGGDSDAATALETVRARGFGGAYVARVSP